MNELVPARYYDQNDDDARAKLQAEGAWSGEAIQTRKDGGQIVVQISGNLARDDAGHPTHVVGINRDITERKQAEEALQESQERMRAIIDASSDVIHLLDVNGVILSSNETYAKRLGLAVDDIVGKNVFDYAQKQAIPKRKAAIEKVFKTGEPLLIEDRGPTSIFEAHVHPVFDPSGEVTAVAVYARDITKHNQAEEKLRESEERLRAVFGSMPDYLMLLDRHHRIQMINRVEPGLKREELIGTPLYELAAPNDRKRVKDLLDRVVLETERQQWDSIVDLPSGSTVHFSSPRNWNPSAGSPAEWLTTSTTSSPSSTATPKSP
jgi:PAS domain S-box-containing protein